MRILQAAPPPAGFRPIALSYASRLILERIGVWQALEPAPIDTIFVSQRGAFGRVRIEAADAGVPALGYVLQYDALLEALLAAAGSLLTAEEPAARCVVHAEGIAEDADEKRYAQDALVGRVRFEPPARGMAFERFTADGPLALLPLGDEHALIWSTRPERARALAAAPEAEFLRELALAAGARPGRPVSAKSLAIQPLALRVRNARVGPRSAYIGNAAQTLHPVAGQGMNLGLRDAWELAQALRESADPGDAAALARFAARRRLDAGAAIRATDWLAKIFLRSSPLTGIAMSVLDVLPGPRRFFARRMIFGASALP